MVGHGKYLGLPSLIGRNKIQLFQSIKERVWKKIAGWKWRLLSKAVKEVLIKAVAQSIPTYCVSFSKLSKKLTKELKWINSTFLVE